MTLKWLISSGLVILIAWKYYVIVYNKEFITNFDIKYKKRGMYRFGFIYGQLFRQTCRTGRVSELNKRNIKHKSKQI